MNMGDFDAAEAHLSGLTTMLDTMRQRDDPKCFGPKNNNQSIMELSREGSETSEYSNMSTNLIARNESVIL